MKYVVLVFVVIFILTFEIEDKKVFEDGEIKYYKHEAYLKQIYKKLFKN